MSINREPFARQIDNPSIHACIYRSIYCIVDLAATDKRDDFVGVWVRGEVDDDDESWCFGHFWHYLFINNFLTWHKPNPKRGQRVSIASYNSDTIFGNMNSGIYPLPKIYYAHYARIQKHLHTTDTLIAWISFLLPFPLILIAHINPSLNTWWNSGMTSANIVWRQDGRSSRVI